MLQQVRRGVVDVATSRKRLELQIQQLQASADRMQQQAAQALSGGREDLAREVLTRRSGVQQQLLELQRQHEDLQLQEEKLTTAAQRLQSKVEAFRTRKETIKATYSAAEAQTRIGEAVSGISEEMGDVGLAVQRAEDKTQQLQARAGAIDGLLASGALDDLSGGSDPVQAELDRMSSASDVEIEMTRLRQAIGQSEAPRALPEGDAGRDTSQAGAQAPQAARPEENR
jgi:phage shock protein A